MNMHAAFRLVVLMSLIGFTATSVSFSASSGVGPGSPDNDAVLTQGKELYASGQYMAALDKFMKVLRRDPRDPEARDYLRLVVDQLRQQRAAGPGGTIRVDPKGPLTVTSPGSVKSPPVSTPSLPPSEQDAQQKLRKRLLLTTDLASIPGVKVNMDTKNAFVEIETSYLFADRTGGLREEGVPLLDRVAAWLKTFAQEPIAVHCLPEELEDPSTGGVLYLHRYAQLYGFFVDERKVPAARFMAVGPVSDQEKARLGMSPDDMAVASSSSTVKSKIVIVAMGGADARGVSIVSPSPSRWLEFSVLAQPFTFNPDEGEWATLDLAALAPLKARSWRFRVTPVSAGQNGGKPSEAVMLLEGTGNLFKRISWDGRQQKAARFVPAGKYLCRLEATNVDGITRTQELTLEVKRNQKAAPVAKPARVKTPAKQAASKSATKPKADSIAANPVNTTPVAAPVALDPAVEAPVAAEPAPAEPAVTAGMDDDGSSDAIWKQVIQFDANDSELKPSVKASLERIGKTLEVYPLQKVRITGFAMATEANAAGLAQERATRVRQTLTSEYGVDPKRILIADPKTGSSGKVEISITN